MVLNVGRVDHGPGRGRDLPELADLIAPFGWMADFSRRQTGPRRPCVITWPRRRCPCPSESAMIATLHRNPDGCPRRAGQGPVRVSRRQVSGGTRKARVRRRRRWERLRPAKASAANPRESKPFSRPSRYAAANCGLNSRRLRFATPAPFVCRVLGVPHVLRWGQVLHHGGRSTAPGSGARPSRAGS